MAFFRTNFFNHFNSELEQAVIRFVFGLLIGAYYIFGFHWQSLQGRGLFFSVYTFVGVFFVCSSAIVFANLVSPQPSVVRRSLGILLDMASISFCLYLGGEKGSFLFSLYLWVLVGNGLRFGKTYLWAAMAAALLGFSLVVASTSYWQQNTPFTVGVYFLIVALPLYFSKLLTRLQNVNNDLERRVEERTKELAVEKNNALESSYAKSQFLANMSHELRTPLNAIIGYSEILLEDALSQHKDQLADDLLRINASGQHLLAMIGDILDLSRIESGKISLQPQRFKLLYFIDEMVKSIMPMLIETGNHISLDRIPETLEIESDKTRMRQIILNLLGNAIKFTKNGLIHVGINLSRPGWVAIQIKDTGIGIDKEHLNNIFELFTQVDQSFTRHYGGSGLGLAICKRFSKLMGGEISVSSVPNQGSTFTVSLPLNWPKGRTEENCALAS